MMQQETIIEGRCVDCVMDLLQVSGRGPGRYGYCRLRRMVLEYPWAMICQHYQYWGDRPTPGKPRLLLNKAVHPILDYSSQKPIQVSLTPEELTARHADEVDDDARRNLGATVTARDFIDESPQKQYHVMLGGFTGYNPYNFVLATNALHHFPLEEFPEEKRRELLDRMLAKDRKADLSRGPGIVADKLVYAAAWSLARTGRDLMGYIDSLRLKKHKPGYEGKLLEAGRRFVQNPNLKPRKSVFSFLFGR